MGNRWNWSTEKFLEEIYLALLRIVSSIFNPTTIEGLLADLYAELQLKANLTEYQPIILTDGVDIANIEDRKQTPTGKALNVQIGPGDVISNIPVITDFGHHQIHEGESYSYCNLQTGGLASGSNFDIRISVPALAPTTRTPHMIFEIIADGTCEIYFHKDVTWTNPGTAVAASSSMTGKDNRNHNVVTAAATNLFVNGGTALTVNALGTLKYIWYLVTGSPRAGSSDRAINEIDLAASTEYMLRVTSRATSLKFLIRLDWYEDLGV